MQFTKDTSKVLTVIYKMYLERRKNGQSKSSAKNFDLEFYSGRAWNYVYGWNARCGW